VMAVMPGDQIAVMLEAMVTIILGIMMRVMVTITLILIRR
jgi:hypothetical protein